MIKWQEKLVKMCRHAHLKYFIDGLKGQSKDFQIFDMNMGNYFCLLHFVKVFGKLFWDNNVFCMEENEKCSVSPRPIFKKKKKNVLRLWSSWKPEIKVSYFFIYIFFNKGKNWKMKIRCINNCVFTVLLLIVIMLNWEEKVEMYSPSQ